VPGALLFDAGDCPLMDMSFIEVVGGTVRSFIVIRNRIVSYWWGDTGRADGPVDGGKREGDVTPLAVSGDSAREPRV